VLAVAGLHLVVVGACSRVAGLRSSTTLALAIVAVVYAAAGVALVALDRRAEAAALDAQAGVGSDDVMPPDRRPRGTSAFRHTG